MTTSAKQKVSLSLDADLVAEFEQDGPLSTSVNEALRAEQHRRRHARALDQLVAAFERQHGSLDTPADVAAIERYVDLLS
jgi:hypothetical protein